MRRAQTDMLELYTIRGYLQDDSDKSKKGASERRNHSGAFGPV